MNNKNLTIFALSTLFSLSCLLTTAKADLSRPPTDKQQYATHTYPIPLADVEKMRKTFERYSGHVPKNNILVVDRVRTGSGGGGGIACFENDDTVEQVIHLGTRQIFPSRVHLIKWLLPFDATLEDPKTQKRYVRHDLTPSYPNESAINYLIRILDTSIAKYDAGVAERIKSVILNQLNKDKWLWRSPLPVINDNVKFDANDKIGSNIQGLLSTLLFKVDHPNCPSAWYVQLALRYQLLDSGKTILDVDPYLLAMMRNTNAPYNPQSPLSATVTEALLIMHEALYYMFMQRGLFEAYYVNQISGHLLSRSHEQLRMTVPQLATVL